MSTDTEKLRHYYQKLFQDGYLVSLRISKWSPTQLLEKRDLQIEVTPPGVYSLGKKYIVPPKYLSEINGIESKARQLIYSNSYRFPVSEAHFIPRKKLAAVLTELEKAETAFNTAVEKFIGSFDTAVGEAIEQFATFYDAEEMVRIKQMYWGITPESLREDFSFSVALFELAMPEQLTSVDAKTVLAVADACDEAEKETRARLDSYLAAQYKQSAKQIETFIEQASATLFNRVAEMCDRVRAKIQNGDVVTKASTDKLKADIAQFHAMNFFDSDALTKEITQLENLLAQDLDMKTDQAAIAALDDVLLQLTTKTLTTQDRITLSDSYLIPLNI